MSGEPSLTYLRPEVLKLKQRLDVFINEEVIPAESEYDGHMKDRHYYDNSDSDNTKEKNDRWSIDAIPPCLFRLQSRAKELGLWNMFLPPRLLQFPHWDSQILGNELRPSVTDGFTYREYGILAESTGKSVLGPMACNSSAPDTGNMEVLLEFGTQQQKQTYLKPLLEGKIRSTFLMTEPDVASSDPTNLQTVLIKHEQNGGNNNNKYTLNGKKWWSTGAMDPRCRIGICVAKIVDGNEKDDDNNNNNNNNSTANESIDNLHGKHTIVLIPLPHKKVKMVRPLTVFGYDDAPFGHAEVELDSVPLQQEHLIGGLGSGFKVSQARLGPGRIHHCMRSIGLAQRCYDLMLQRSTERKTFGKYLCQHGSVQTDIAESFNDLHQARLLTLHCAHQMDISSPVQARQFISGIKVAVPALCFRVIDRALQVHGGLGVCEDTVLASAWANMRTLRIADGPDEVHRRSVARMEIKKLFLEATKTSEEEEEEPKIHKSRL